MNSRGPHGSKNTDYQGPWSRVHFERAFKWEIGDIESFLKTHYIRGTNRTSTKKGAGNTHEESQAPNTTSQGSQSSGNLQSDLENLWNKALKPYFDNIPDDILVKEPFKDKMHGQEVEILSAFCALAAVLNLKPIRMPRHPINPPLGEFSWIQYQWLLVTLLGKWTIEISASPKRQLISCICVMSRKVGENTVYVCGTTKPKLNARKTNLSRTTNYKDGMRRSRHLLLDKAFGEHPLKLEPSIPMDTEEIHEPLSTPLERTALPEEALETTEYLLRKKIHEFSVAYKDNERKRVSGEGRNYRLPNTAGQRIGDCTEVWGVATLVGLKDLGGKYNTSPLVSIAVDTSATKDMTVASCIDHTKVNHNPACGDCTYFFNVAQLNLGVKSIDNMYPDGVLGEKAVHAQK